MTDRIYPVKTKIRIDWSEIDYFGHVNNVNYFKYIQAARVQYVEKIDMLKLHEESKIGPTLASCKCDFKIPLFYPGEVTILTRVDFIKNTSFGISHQIIDDKNQIAAEAHDILVMFDFNTNKKTRLSNEMRKRIEELEGRKF